MLKKRTMPFFLLALLAASALAHDTWLLARQSTVAPGTTLTLDLTSGMAFPTLAFAIQAARIDQAFVRLGGQTAALGETRSAPHSLQFSVPLKASGCATLWVELKPKTLELTPPKVRAYLDEIGAPPEIRQAWATARPQRWRETYQKHAKTYARVGAASDASWAEPAGLALEIVPEKDPTSLRAGDDFPVRVLRQGAPLASFPLGLVRAKSAKGSIQKTNAEGRVTFKLKQAGQWLLRGTELRKATTDGIDWESDFTTLTITVK